MSRGAAAVALVYAVVLGALAAAGVTTFVDVPYAAWPAAAVLLVGAAAAFRAVVPLLWAVAGLALAGSCWVLLSLVELALTGAVTNRDGSPGWVAFAERLGLVAVSALFTASAIAHRRRVHVHAAGVTCAFEHPEPHTAPPLVRRIADAGCAAFLPYFVLHFLGAAGVPGIEPHGFRPPWAAVLAGAAGIGLACFLLLGLVRPWGMVFPRWTVWLAGRRVPRFLPLAPVWLIAPTLALYGTGSFFYGLFSKYGVLGLGGAASIAFAGYGWALAIAAVSYQQRTRPICRSFPTL
ncbi:hypothetical protein [Dactylosporangium sp. CS-033363]|uniref:hypothetical protein n=1 Tax=Dactylosporangium sp. CS-033363 TaxID=3239935 RepID=UPI003D93EBFE